jgi:hypothetical protein
VSIIAASSVKCATLADGTLRITIEVEPKDALDAFTLFRAPGTPMAITALKDGYAQPSSTPAEQTPPAPAKQDGEALKGGELSKWVAMRCNEPEFRDWLARRYPGLMACGGVVDATVAAHIVRSVCEISSRAQLDHEERAAQRFHDLIRQPYATYRASPPPHWAKQESERWSA